jgi:O-antigen ligase
VITFVSFCLLTIGWAYAVFDNGGNQASWRWCVLAVALAGLLQWLSPGDRKRGRRPRKLDRALVFVLLLLALLQTLPLPLGLIRVLSPQRFSQLTAVSQVIGPVTSATFSSVPAATRDAALVLAVYALVYLLVADLRRRAWDRPWIMAAPIIGVALLEALLGLVQYYGGADIATGSYVNRNHYAGLLEMSLPFALMGGFFVLNRNRDRFQTPARPTILACLFFAAAALMLVSVINSQSRMGFISVLASLLVTGVVAVSSHFSEAAAWRRWLPVIAVGTIVVLAFIFLPTDQLIGRFATMATTQEPSEDTRREIWRETLPLVRAYPIAGCGLGAYESCFLPYKKVAPVYTVDFAHNDYLQVMSEFGIPAFAMILLLVALAYATALRGTSVGNQDRYLAIACTGALTAILLHSFVDFNLYMPANGMLAAWVTALAREA